MTRYVSGQYVTHENGTKGRFLVGRGAAQFIVALVLVCAYMTKITQRFWDEYPLSWELKERLMSILSTIVQNYRSVVGRGWRASPYFFQCKYDPFWQFLLTFHISLSRASGIPRFDTSSPPHSLFRTPLVTRCRKVKIGRREKVETWLRIRWCRWVSWSPIRVCKRSFPGSNPHN